MTAVDDFLKTIIRSGLLDREQLQAALRDVPREQRDNPQALADHLTQAGSCPRELRKSAIKAKPSMIPPEPKARSGHHSLEMAALDVFDDRRFVIAPTGGASESPHHGQDAERDRASAGQNRALSHAGPSHDQRGTGRAGGTTESTAR